MLRWIDQFILTILLLISVALIALWFRSQSIGDRFRWFDVAELPDGSIAAEMTSLMTGEGGVGFRIERRAGEDEESAARVKRWIDRATRFGAGGYTRTDDPRYPMRGGANETMLSPLGLHYVRETRGGSLLRHEVLEFTIPLWLPLLLIAAYPLTRFFLGVMRREQQERAVLGLCPRCGCNVQKSPDRCPACGKRKPLLGTGLAPASTNAVTHTA